MTLKNLSTQFADRLPAADDLLHLIGLQQQRTASDVTLGMLGSFALGTLVGGVMALLLAPTSGEEMRRQLGERLDGTTQKVKDRLAATGESATQQVS